MPRSFLILLSLISLMSCQQNDQNISYLLDHKYANKYVNNPEQKIKIIQSLNEQKITDENIDQVNLKLNQLGDGHVYLQKPNEDVFKYKTDLVFIPGTQLISSCEKSCKPKLNGKFLIEEIDGLSLLDYYHEYSKNVFASSEQGKYHRTFQLLQFAHTPIKHQLKLKDISGKIQFVELNSINELTKNEICVEGKRIDKSTYYVKVNTLWCNLNGKISDDKEIFKAFESQWNSTINNIELKDNIVLDLRENNGGGDNEVMLILNTFIDHQVILYKYQYLKSAMYSKKERFAGLLQLKNTIWGKVGIDYTNQKLVPAKRLFHNNLKTLISPGCFSSCEGLAGNLKVHKRSKLYGSTTHGGAGDPKMHKIKDSNYLINLPSCLVWLADGSLIEGKGISPDLISRDAFLFNNDEVLNSVLKN